jgi:hypothetical protein
MKDGTTKILANGEAIDMDGLITKTGETIKRKSKMEFTISFSISYFNSQDFLFIKPKVLDVRLIV